MPRKLTNDEEDAAKMMATVAGLANLWMVMAMKAGHDNADILMAALVVAHRVRTRGDLPADVRESSETVAALVCEALDANDTPKH